MTETASTSIRVPGFAALALPVALALGGCGLLAVAPPQYPAFTTPSGVVVQDQVIPTGDQLPFVRGGERLTVHYEIQLPDGEVLDSSLDRAEPLQFVLGNGEVPLGLDEGLIGMREFGLRRLTMSERLAFGGEGAPDDVPSSDTYVFEVELIDVEGGQIPITVDSSIERRWWGE